MRKHVVLMMSAGLWACGGSETPPPAPEPAPEPAAEPAPAAEPVAAPAPAPAADVPDLAAMSEADRHAWLMTTGETVYRTGGTGGIACQTCHMDAGQGAPGAFPPLAGAGDAMGDCKKHAGYVVHGLSGEIEVLGVKYNGIMPPQGNLPDHEIAAVITFERNSFGNALGDCMPSDVAAARTP